MSGVRLVRALERSAVAHGCAAKVTLVAERDWASATFVGSSFDVAMALRAGAEAEAWIAGLPEVDLPMPRQFARTVTVVGREDLEARVALMVEAVVLED